MNKENILKVLKVSQIVWNLEDSEVLLSIPAWDNDECCLCYISDFPYQCSGMIWGEFEDLEFHGFLHKHEIFLSENEENLLYYSLLKNAIRSLESPGKIIFLTHLENSFLAKLMSKDPVFFKLFLQTENPNTLNIVQYFYHKC